MQVVIWKFITKNNLDFNAWNKSSESNLKAGVSEENPSDFP